MPLCLCGHAATVHHAAKRGESGAYHESTCTAGASVVRDTWNGGCPCRKFIDAATTINREDETPSEPVAMSAFLKAVTDDPDVTPQAVSILEDAIKLISGDRHEDYGPANDEFDRIAAGWQIIFEDGEFTSKRVAMAMVWLKVCRELAGAKRDNWTDMAGYAGLGGAL